VLDDILPPFEFTVEFLLLVVAWGAAIEAARPLAGSSRLRRVMSLGFVVIGAAQFVLGLRILDADASSVSSLIRGAGYLLILVGLSRAPAQSHQINAFLPLAFLPLALLPANVALASAAIAFFVSARGATIHARDQRPESFSFASAFAFLGASEALHVLDGDGWLVLRFATRGLGSFLLLLWLFGRFNSIRIRFATRAIVSLVVGLLFLAAGFNVVISRTLTAEEGNRLAEASRTRIDRFEELEFNAVGRAALLSRGFESTFATGSDPQRTANSIINLIDPADFLVVVNADSEVVASAEPFNDGSGVVPRELPRVRTLPIQAGPVVTGAMTRGVQTHRLERLTFTNAEGRSVNEIVALGAAPIASADPRVPAGVLVVGYRIDAEQIGLLARDTGAIALLEINGEFATIRGPDGRAFPLEDQLRAALAGQDFTSEDETDAVAIDIVLPADGSSTRAEDQRYLVVAAPIIEDGIVVGTLLLASSPDALAGVLAGLTRVLFFLLLIALVVSGAYAMRSGRRVTQPLVALTEASLALRAGDLSARADVVGDDEIGTLSAAFNAMAIDLEATTSELKDSVEAETSLRGRLEAIVQSMGDALLAFDAGGRITTVNRAAERLLGIQVDQVTGTSIATVLDGNADGGGSLAQTISTATSGAGSLRIGRAQRLVSFQSRPLAGPDGTTGRVVVIRDETETRQAERMKDEFLANVSHELRTPLTPIRGFADILTRKDVPREKAAEYLRKILESSLRLERIVDILVDFAAIEAGRMPIRTESLPVALLVRERGRDWEELEPDRTIRTRVQRGVGRLLGDPTIVVRSLDELIDNAIKFSEGPVTISAGVEGSARARLVRITVSDRGPGIPDDRLADIFRGFQQVNGGETREIGGLGLGLAFVKRAIEHIGGTVEVESSAGHGTDVSILLPEAGARPASPKRRVPGSEVAASAPPGKGTRSA
jgi:PAS domain S-box-containing protein